MLSLFFSHDRVYCGRSCMYETAFVPRRLCFPKHVIRKKKQRMVAARCLPRHMIFELSVTLSGSPGVSASGALVGIPGVTNTIKSDKNKDRIRISVLFSVQKKDGIRNLPIHVYSYWKCVVCWFVGHTGRRNKLLLQNAGWPPIKSDGCSGV